MTRKRVVFIFALTSFLFSASSALGQFVQQGPKVLATDAIGTPVEFGTSVCLSRDGSTAIVGGPLDNGNIGAAWIFTRSGGTWIQQGPKLVGTGYVGEAQQGASVSISADGNTAIVGGPLDDSSVGAAWIFTRSGDTWNQQGPKLVASDSVPLPSQGNSVSLSADGNTAIIGGPGDNGGIGAAWVFVRSGGTWRQQGSKLVGSGYVKCGYGLVEEGTSVSLSGDGNTAILGGVDDNNYVGAAWVFTRSGDTWRQQGSKLIGSGYVGGDYGIVYEGASVSLSGDGITALVGGYNDNNGIGAVWVFARVGDTWSQQGPKLTASDSNGEPFEGFSVCLSGDGNTAIIGGFSDAWYDNGPGAAWVFARSGGTWAQQGSKLIGSNAVGTSLQGYSVAISSDGSTAIVGGPWDQNQLGAIWFFVASGCPLNCTSSVAGTGTINQQVTFSATASPTGCSGTPTFDWDFGDGTQHGAAASVTHAYTSAGTKNWTLTVSLAGASPCTKSGTITISSGCTAPSVTLQPSSTIIASGQSATLLVAATGTPPLTYQWYRGNSGDTSNLISGATASTYNTDPLTQTTSYWVRVMGQCTPSADSVTATVTISAVTGGTLLAWGDNTYGQLGNGTMSNSNVPVQVSGLASATLSTGGDYHSLSINNEGTLWAWGDNSYGQLGNGTNSTSNVPVQVTFPGGTVIVSIAAGRHHSVALKSDHTVWAWGDNTDGQLGNGTNTDSNVPVQVVGAAGLGFLNGITAIAGGGYHALALKSDGTVWAWGGNWAGQLGNGSTDSSKLPVQVVGAGGMGFLNGVIAITGGDYQSFALKNDHTVWAWGWNQEGELGNGTNTGSLVPVQVSGLTNVIAITSSMDHCLALKSDTTVSAWGYNSAGQLGNGTTGDSNVPVPVTGLLSVTAIAAGGGHSLALKNDGTVWAWGRNIEGQLGNGTNSESHVPVRATFSGGTSISAIAVGNSHSMAVTGSAPSCPTITFSPSSLPSGTVGLAYNQTITASGGATPYTYTVTSGSPPTGLTLHPTTGVLDGTPTTTVGSPFGFTVAVTDAHGCPGNRPYTIQINPAACPTITLAPVSLPNGTVGTAYGSQTISATGGAGPYGYAVTSGSLPTGLSLSTGGVLSGTPTAATTSNFTITATDSSAQHCTGSRSYSITISTPPGPGVAILSPSGSVVAGMPTIKAHASLQAGTTLQGLIYTVDGTSKWSGSANDYAFTWDVTSFANGSTHTIGVTATDSAGGTTTVSKTVTVRPLISGRLVFRDPITGNSWNFDKVANFNDQTLVRIDLKSSSGVPYLTIKIASDGTYNSKAIWSGSETSIPIGTPLSGSLTLRYTDNITVDNQECGTGCAPPTGGQFPRTLKPNLTIQPIPQGVPSTMNIPLPLPVVLIHGIRSCYQGWSQWADYLTQNGYIVYSPNHTFRAMPSKWCLLTVNNTASKDGEAAQLKNQVDLDFNGISTQTPDHYFICHSEGGVIARVLLAKYYDYSRRVKRVFTLGTPHSGTDSLFASGYDLDVGTMLTTLNTTYSRFQIPVFAISGHSPLEYRDCGYSHDGIVWWQRNDLVDVSPFAILLATGSRSNPSYIVTQQFEGYGQFPTVPSDHHACFNHSDLTSSAAISPVLQGTIIPIMQGSKQPVADGEGTQAVGESSSAAQSETICANTLTLASGAGQVVSVPVGGTDQISVDWMDYTGGALFRLTDPNGVLLDPQNLAAYPNASYASDNFGEHFAVLSPLPGTWSLSIQAPPVGGAVVLSFRQNATWGVRGQTDKASYHSGESGIITAQAVGIPATAVLTSVQAVITSTDGQILMTVPLFDDGLHGDGSQGDGVYGNSFQAPSATGRYFVSLGAAARDSGVPTRRETQALFTVVPDAHALTGTFTDQAADQDSDGVMDHIVVTAGLSLPEAGDYTISADLQDGAGYDVGHAVGTVTVSSPGPATVDLPFDMTGVACDRYANPFCVKNLQIVSASKLAIVDTYDGSVCTQQYGGGAFGCVGTGDPLPTVTVLYPNSARPGETKQLTLSGTGFHQGATVSFGGADVTLVSAVSWLGTNALSFAAYVSSSAEPGVRDVTVTNPDGRSVTASGEFAVVADQAPVVHITYPADQQVVAEAVVVSASAQDDGSIQRVEFFVDGALEATKTEFPYQWTWDTRASANGIHTLGAVAYDDTSLSSEEVISVTASNPCALSCTASAPATSWVGQSIGFVSTATPSNCTGSVTYDWDFGDGSGHSSQPSPDHTYASAGTFAWSFTASADGQTCSRTGTISVCTLSCGASASVTTGVAPLTVTFTGSATVTGGCAFTPTYDWNFGDGTAPSSQQSPSHVYTSAGNYTWTLTVTASGASCTKSGSLQVSPPSITVISPHCAEVWRLGEQHTITWTPQGVTGNATIRMDFPGSSYPLGAADISQGYFAFTVPTNWPIQNNWQAVVTADGPAGPVWGTSCPMTIAGPPPEVTLLKKVTPPFKIVVTGSNLQSGIKVYIDGTQWTSVVWKKTTKIQLTGAIKTAVPKGTTHTFRFVNPDGGEASQPWGW